MHWPNKCVHMLPVSVWTLKTDLKHFQKEFIGGLCPLTRKSLSLSHFGRWLWWTTSHPAAHIRFASSSALARIAKRLGSAFRPVSSPVEGPSWSFCNINHNKLKQLLIAIDNNAIDDIQYCHNGQLLWHRQCQPPPSLSCLLNCSTSKQTIDHYRLTKKTIFA